MNETEVAVYRMNPAEDKILFGDELAEGMLVLPEADMSARLPGGSFTEDDKIRAQLFRRVTRLRITHEHGSTQAVFVGEWIDGYQMVHSYNATIAWLVKKDPPGEEDSP